jgi:hypothetical protein
VHFVAPFFALFTVAAVVPVLIHLIGRSRARVRPFPALAFLLAGHRKVAQRTRLRQLLLLLLRAAVMAAVPLCLAKPFVEAVSDLPAQLRGAQSSVFLIDDSLAMGYRLGGETLLNRATARAGRLIDALDHDADAALVLGARGSVAPVAELTSDRARLLRALSSVRPTYRPADLSAALKRAAQILSSSRGLRRIYLFTDLSAHSLEPGVVPPPDVEVVPIDVTDGKPLPNRAIVDLRVDPAPALGRSGVRITAEVANFSEQPVKDLPVTLVVDGKAVTRGLLDLPARGRAVKRFYHSLEHAPGQTSGPLSGQVPAPTSGRERPSPEARPGEGRRPAKAQGEGDAAPAGIHDLSMELARDDLPDDDVRYLRVEVQRILRVLIVDGDPRGLRREDEVFYLETALRPGDREDSQLDTATITVDELSQRSLSEYDAVFLCNIKAQDLSRLHVVPALRDYVDKGGGIFLSMGDNVDPDAYNSTLGNLLPQPLAGTKTAGPVQRPGDDADGRDHEAAVLGAGERLGRLDRRHPLLLPFSGGHAAESLHEARFGRYMLLRPTMKTTGTGGGLLSGAEDPSATVTALLTYEGGAPALIERTLGAGHVLLFTSTLDRDWNDLPIQPAYLALIQQAARYLSRAPLREAEPPALVGQHHEIKLRDGDVRVEVTLPSGQKRLFEGDRVKGRRRLGFTDTDEPGLYHVAVAGEGGGLRPRPSEFFAVNVDPGESDRRRAPPARIEALSRLLPSSSAGPSGDGLPRRRIELWHAIGAVILLLLLGEALLLREK